MFDFNYSAHSDRWRHAEDFDRDPYRHGGYTPSVAREMYWYGLRMQQLYR